MNCNTHKNMEIKKEFFRNHVYVCVTNLMLSAIEGEKNSGNEFLWKFEILEFEGKKHFRQDLEKLKNELEIDEAEESRYSQVEKVLMEGDYEVPEINHYYIVSDYLGRHLKKEGEIVIEEFNNTIWGRQGCGQAVFMDDCMSNIAKKIGILVDDDK